MKNYYQKNKKRILSRYDERMKEYTAQRKKFKADRHNSIVKDFFDEMPPNEMSEKYGITHGMIIRIVKSKNSKEYYIYLEQRKNKKRDVIVNDFVGGLTIKEVSTKHNITLEGVRLILIEKLGNKEYQKYIKFYKQERTNKALLDRLKSRIEVKCKKCNKKFTKYPDQKKTHCSAKCASLSRGNLSKTTKRKISESKKKKVVVIKGNKRIVFKSINEASKHINRSASAISNVLAGRQNNRDGYQFEYAT